MTLKLRPYQERVVTSAGSSNAIIRMPTGSGKTFVAAELIRRKLRQSSPPPSPPSSSEDGEEKKQSSNCTTSTSFHSSLIALFLVPTCELVSQQAKALHQWITESSSNNDDEDCNNDALPIVQYMGGMQKPTHNDDFKILVATPMAFLMLQPTHPRLAYSNISIIVFDEVHHVLKDHPYRRIALSLPQSTLKETTTFDPQTKQEHTSTPPILPNLQIIGLSASLTYAVEIKSIDKALSRLCHELSIQTMLSPTEQELIDGGYNPQQSRIHVHSSTPNEIPDGVLPPADRKPHLMYQTFMNRSHSGSLTPFARTIFDVVRALEKEVEHACQHLSRPNVTFESPLGLQRLSSWEEYAHSKAMGLNSLDSEQMQIKPLLVFLEVWYVALRMVAQSWEEEEGLVLRWLLLSDGFVLPPPLSSNPFIDSDRELTRRCSEKVEEMARSDSSFVKFVWLKGLLAKEKGTYRDNFRCLIFVQKRIAAYILDHYIRHDTELQKLKIQSGFVASKTSKITPSIKVRTADVKRQIDLFRKGEVNVLVTTSVIEEGFDVPSVNVVISYDHMNDSVQLCQRFGRARQDKTSLIVMAERSDRPISRLKEVTQRQTETIQSFDSTKMAAVNKKMTESMKQGQSSREKNAVKVVFHDAKLQGKPLAALHIFVQKTRGDLKELYMKRDDNDDFQCAMVYQSMSRVVDGCGRGGSKKVARAQCALAILKELKNQIMDVNK